MKYPEQSLDSEASTQLPVDVGPILRAAVESQGFQHQIIASEIGYQGDYWNKVLGHTRGITLDRLGKLPVEVQREFVRRWADTLGVSLDGLAGLADLIASRRVRITIESR